MPPLNALKSFEAAARRGSFQLAAEELFVTPSAISHQIKSLEAFLGLELFFRQPRQILLTKAGKDYFLSIQKALMEVDRATQSLISTHQSGELHLSVAPAFLTRWLLPRISRFHEDNSDVKMEISAATGLIDFDRTETDMAVYFGHGQWQGIEIHFLKDYQLVPVCSPKLLSKLPIHKPEDLYQHTLLHVNKRVDEWPKWFNEANTPFEERVQGVYFSSAALTTAAALNGVGVALANVGFVSEEIASGDLIVPIEIFLPTDKSFYLVYQKNRAMTYAMKAFQLWIMDEMKKSILSSAH